MHIDHNTRIHTHTRIQHRLLMGVTHPTRTDNTPHTPHTHKHTANTSHTPHTHHLHHTQRTHIQHTPPKRNNRSNKESIRIIYFCFIRYYFMLVGFELVSELLLFKCRNIFYIYFVAYSLIEKVDYDIYLQIYCMSIIQFLVLHR